MASSDRKKQATDTEKAAKDKIIPTGTLLRLTIDQITPSRNNPRKLFDDDPLKALRDNIQQHGVLVPITVYKMTGRDTYGILDGERRYRCAVDLNKGGHDIDIPANLVEPPNKVAGLLYMFSIHNFREGWELMPTALGLQTVMDVLGISDDVQKINRLTGLSEPQIERCKKILSFPKKYQAMSLEADPNKRIPSNFWIELHPLLDLVNQLLPDLIQKHGRDGITDKLVEKYRAKRIKSVIHFRRILEAHDVTEEKGKAEHIAFTKRLLEYLLNTNMETRAAFDEFVVDSRRVQNAVEACDSFVTAIKRTKIDHVLDKEDLRKALEAVRDFAQEMISKLQGTDAPSESTEAAGE